MFRQFLRLILLPLLLLLPDLALAVNHPELRPHVPSFIDKHSLHNLNQTLQAHIWYREHARKDLQKALHASLNLTFHHPTVVLDHSFHTTESCTATALSIHFFSKNAFQHAWEAWSRDEGITFVTSKSSCARFNADGHHAFFSSSDIHYDAKENIVKATGNFVTLSDVASHAKIHWGHVTNSTTSVQTATKKPTSTSKVVKTTVKPTTKRLEERFPLCSTDYDGYESCYTRPTRTPIEPTPTGGGFTSGIYSVNPVPTASCAAPSPYLSGLPAVHYCDSDFDARLDQAIGYLFNLDDPDVWLPSVFAQIAPGIADDPSNFEVFDDLSGRSLDRRELLERRVALLKRGWFKSIKRLISSVAHTVAKAVASVASSVAQAVARAATVAAQAVVSVVKAVVNHVFSPSVSMHLPIKWKWSQLTLSPWGYAHLIHLWKSGGSNTHDQASKDTHEKEKKENVLLMDDFDGTGVAIYCVDCYIKAFFDASGFIDFSIADGIIDGEVRVRGDVEAQIQIGVDAVYILKNFTLAEVQWEYGLPGFQIPGIIVVGPYFLVKMTAATTIKAEGQLLAGWNMSMPDAIAVHNFVDHNKSYSSGWNPTTHKTLDVHGELGVGFALEVPFGVAFGISILGGKWERKIGIANTPSLNIDASIEVEWEYEAITLPDGTTTYKSTPLKDIWGGKDCPGIGMQLSLQDRLEVDIFSKKDYTIWAGTKTLDSTCITLWSKPTSTPSPTPPSLYGYMGCYQDALGYGAANRSLSASNPITQGSTVEACEAACAGYLYYGVEYYGQCFCANSAEVGTVPSTACNYPCTANPSETCGGFWTINIYSYQNPGYATYATAGGLQYWAWLTYGPQDVFGKYVNVKALANSGSWVYTGTVDNINVFTTTWTSPYTITFPGQSSIDDGTALTANLQGYFVPKMDGIYTFTPVSYDNKLLIWTGPEAHTGYGWQNAVINQYDWTKPSTPTTLIVKAGQLVPITILWINWSGPGKFQIQITAPDGTSTLDTTGYFVHDPNAQINDGHYDDYKRKRDVVPPPPSSVETAGDSMMTSPPAPATFERALKRQINSASAIPASNVPNTATLTVTNSNGDVGTVSGDMVNMGDLPQDTNMTDFSFPSDSTFVWVDPIYTLDEFNGESPNPNTTEPDLDYAFILDVTGSMQLHTGDDHNLYLVSPDPDDVAAHYAGLFNVYAGDSLGNILIYYNDEMTTLGVSRFRVVSPDAIPATARIVSLAPIATPDHGYVYAAVDTLGNIMYTAFCNIEGSATKVFVVNDLDAGLPILTQPDLAYTVTGGIVSACGPLALAAAGGVTS